MEKRIMKNVFIGFALASFVAHGAVFIGPNTTISFEAGSATLSSESEAKLIKLVKEARQAGRIEEVKVAVWSDSPAPREGEELSKSERDLAGVRAKAIQDCLKRNHIEDIESYNMAERASWLSRAFNTDAADFKAESVKGNKTTLFKEEFQIFKTNGDSSKAVILSLVKHRS